MDKISIFLLVLLFSSCNATGSSGTWWVFALFGVILIIFSVMFYYIYKKKKQKDNRLVSFSASIREMLSRLETPEQKISALNLLVDRINQDEKYTKTPDWKNNVLTKVYEHLGAVYYQAGDTNNAVNAFSQVIELDPGHGMSYYNRGSVYSNTGKYEKALKDFDDAILLMPDYPNAYNNRGLVLYRMGKYEQALSDFDYAIGTESSAITYYNRANTLYELNELQRAREDFFKSIELDKEDTNGLRNDITNSISLIDNKLNENHG